MQVPPTSRREDSLCCAAHETAFGTQRVKFILIVLLLAAACEVAEVVAFDAIVVADNNCDSGDAAVCLESLFYLAPGSR